MEHYECTSEVMSNGNAPRRYPRQRLVSNATRNLLFDELLTRCMSEEQLTCPQLLLSHKYLNTAVSAISRTEVWKLLRQAYVTWSSYTE